MAPILRFAGAALFAAFLAIAARAQSAAMAPEKSWALAASAILTERNGDRHDLLGGQPRTSENIAEAADLLKRSWSVTDRSDLLDSLSNLRDGGHRASFNRLGKLAALGPVDTPQDSEERRQVEIATKYYPKFGSKSILAWDYMRYISLCRWGYLAGYFSEEEA